MSLEETDQAAKDVQKTPNRVALADIESKIERIRYITGSEIDAWLGGPASPHQDNFDVMTVCFITVSNGFSVLGKSAPADPGNFNADLGKKFAYEDAVRQLWPLYGFALRERLSNDVPA